MTATGLHDMPPLVVQPDVVTILGTYKCTATCENCCFGSNPHLTKRLDREDILRFIEQAAKYPRCRLVVFSGGECFLLRDDLVAAVAHATRLGLATRCVTNGFWAKRLEHGHRRLSALVNAGLTELNISTGDYHQRWVAQETVVNAACLSVELGLANTVIMVELQKERRVTAEELLQEPRLQALASDESAHFRVIESPWMPMSLEGHIDQPSDQVLSRRTLHLRHGCESVLSTVVLTPDKKFGYCCGLTREQIPELNVPWSPDDLDHLIEAGSQDFMKIWLYVEGPERILAWAAEKDPRIEWEGRYAHHCHACWALYADPLVRAAIRTHYLERVDDVLARYVTRLRMQQGDGAGYATHQ